MSSPSSRKTPLLERRFTHSGAHPYEEIQWELRTARIGSEENPVFEQHNVEVPSFWSQNATNIVAQKYFAFGLGHPDREHSVKQLIDRVVNKIAAAGRENDYFADDEEAEIFVHELSYILVHQLASFNSPVWFNIGVEGAPQTASACFILSIRDTMSSITDWYKEEAKIFTAGSGAGINLSVLRGSNESLSRGGVSSGPVSFMRAADANAGTIQSGGVTRRAAKLVCLDVDHPDIEDFVWCKAREEKRIRALAAAGFDMSMDSREMAEATAYQNANNSVRVSDEFMKAVENDEQWALRARRGNDPDTKLSARKLFGDISESAWRCADPGLQYDTTINEWHTTPSLGPITASNPCSEYMSNDDTSCNLASLNLLRFLDSGGNFDVEAFRHTTRVIFTAQEITISFADFPTTKIAKNTTALRQIGIGYTNLGALLMSLGLPYDSPGGRDWAAVVTALLTGESYLQSSRLAERVGPFEHYEANASSMKKVLGKHRAAAAKLNDENVPAELVKAARSSWNETVKRAGKHGVRNAQASVLAPTGTISFMMDADTFGVEPDFSLIKHKVLVGGGTMQIINRAVPRALQNLGYSAQEAEDIVAYLDEEIEHDTGVKAPRNSIVGAPHLREEHYAVFDCAVGDRSIEPMGHVRMMAAVQPFLSGAISKTVNVPNEATAEEMGMIYREGWKLGLKALAVYRDGSKENQPLASKKKAEDTETAVERVTSILGDGLLRGERRDVARDAQVLGVNFKLGPFGQQVGGYIHVRLFDDGTPGALFVDVGQAGSTLHGFIRAWAVTFSLGLQYGVPLDTLVSKLAFTQFEPGGFTDDPEIKTARSIVDFVVRWLAARFLDPDVHGQLGIFTASGAGEPEPEADEAIPGGGIERKAAVHAATVPANTPEKLQLTAERGGSVCTACGGLLVQTGACKTCSSCGATGGCG